MAASSCPVARNWPLSWKRRATSGSKRAMRWLPMANVLANGLSRGAVEQISRQQGEPEWMLEKRLQAWETFENLPAPLGRRGDLGTLRTFANFKFQQLAPYAASEGLRPTIAQSLQAALSSARAGLIVQRNSSVVHSELNKELKSQGVILTSLENAVDR